MVGWLTVTDETCVTYGSHVNQNSTPYKVRMRQDKARTYDTYGTITQHLSFQKN